MDLGALTGLLRAETDAVAAVTPADVDVPTCPGWTLVDLFHHLGSVHRFQLAQIDSADPSTLQPPPGVEAPSDPEDLVDWLVDGADAVADRLEELGPDHLTSSWSGPVPTTFWARRAAHETAVHRWDAEAAVTSPAAFAPDQAADIVDELFEVFLPRRLRRRPWAEPPSTIHLHATDLPVVRDASGRDDSGSAPGGEWLVRVGGGSIEVEHSHAKGDVALRGRASDLALVMFGRIPTSRLEVFGDATIIDRWHAEVRL